MAAGALLRSGNVSVTESGRTAIVFFLSTERRASPFGALLVIQAPDVAKLNLVTSVACFPPP